MSKSRSAIELFSPEYWKEWKERSNVGPLIDPEEEKRKATLIANTRQKRLQELNERGYTYSHPNKGWVRGHGAPGEPNSMLAYALAGGNKVPLDYRPENDHPNMIDLVGHNGDGVTGPLRSTYRGGPRRPKNIALGRANRFYDSGAAQQLDVPVIKCPTNFGSRKQAPSKFRTAPSVSFGSGTQHGGNQRVQSGTELAVIKLKKSKIGGLFSGGGGIATRSLRARGLGEPGPGLRPSLSLTTPTVTVPKLGRTSRWSKSSGGGITNQTTDAMYDLPSIMGATTSTPTVYKSRAVNFGGTLKENLETSIRHGGIDTSSKQSDLDPALKNFKEFGFGCNLEEHIKYGCCLDGGCSTRSTWEKANKQRVDGKADRQNLRKSRRRSMKKLKLSSSTSELTSLSRTGTANSGASTRSYRGSTRGSGISEHSANSRGSLTKTPVSVSTSLASARRKPGAVWGETPCHLATRSGEPDKLKHLLAGVAVWSPKERRMVRKGRDINVVDSQNRTPLHTACYDGNVPMVKVLLDARPKANIDAQDSEGNTPLHLAMIKGEDYVAKMLIAAGCDPDLQNNDGHMPYDLATSHRAYQFAKEASMLVDVRMKKVLNQKKLIALLEKKRRAEEEKEREREERFTSSKIKVTGKSVYASIVRQFQEICTKQRKLYGNIIEDIEDLFDAIDVNGDGCLSVDEIQRGLRRLDLGLTELQVEELVKEADADGNREIDRDEFMNGITRFASM
jgi:hypothetical protein